ncbi:hypothetical protein AMECASPLE_039244 [Ameca splendens]|uniref:Uncharacterized protein n=1 Tax=Ameca splendens TaxID=208324 RepID=A0ABV0YJW8_9TELE
MAIVILKTTMIGIPLSVRLTITVGKERGSYRYQHELNGHTLEEEAITKYIFKFCLGQLKEKGDGGILSSCKPENKICDICEVWGYQHHNIWVVCCKTEWCALQDR